ncbi:MAG: type III polyketide synthase [Spirochaetales bacterium]|nr:type III polyketide synthase [Spirochaetales bacterium]
MMDEENTPVLRRIATAVPPQTYSQEFCLALMLDRYADDPRAHALLSKIYSVSGIAERHSVITDPGDFLTVPDRLTTQSRNDIFITEANRLACLACAELFTEPSLAAKITHLITVSCTGFSIPGFGAEVIRELELPTAVEHYHLGFMGCAASFPALKLARHICLARPDASVLIVAVELCSLHVRKSHQADVIVANSLFADGAAAALVTARREDHDRSGLLLHDFRSRTLPQHAGTMAWKIGATGFDLSLSTYLPAIIEGAIGPIMEEIINETRAEREKIGLWAVHPGGRAILDKFESALRLSPAALAYSRAILRDYGNMSSASILFVLKEILEAPVAGFTCAAGFGPGLVIETALMEKTAG